MLIFGIVSTECTSEPLLEQAAIKQLLTQSHYAELHGAATEYLGPALLYYMLVYAAKAQLCVCLGSGDGFVPRLMRQAQRDLALTNARTILVDGNCGEWGRPTWLSPQSFFRQQYPDIEIISATTAHVAREHVQNWSINYLHIDADRSTEGALQDFLDYLPAMAHPSIITLHDTAPGRPCFDTLTRIRQTGYDAVNIESFGTGVALIVIP
jgi:hypothetical protein